MNWFLGSIQDAVATSKKRKAFFIVYIEGTDELSVIMTKVLDDPVISRKFETNNFVAIKLAKGSEGHKQFEEFYKLVPVPSVFFIDQNGSPAEIVVSETSEENVLKKLNNAIEKCVPANKSNESLPGPSTSKSEQVPASTSSITKDNPAVVAEASTSKVEQIPSNSTIEVKASKVEQIPSNSTIEVKPTIKTEDNSQEKMPTEVESSPFPMDKGEENNESHKEDINKSSPVTEKPPIDDRVERAKLLLEKKKEEKKEDEFKREKEAELERRMAGQKLQLAKREQHERELRQLKEERDREKKEEALARQRILDQIAQDRAERAQRLAMTGSPPPDEEVHETGQDTASSASPASVNSNIGRLQFKLPSGETKSHSFPAETTLLQVREFIDNNIVLPFSEYSMATTFPRREFTARDNNRDLQSLQLLPSAVILILPVQGSVTMRSSLGWTQMIIDMMWDFVQPVISLSRYISNLIFRRDDTVGGSSRNQSTPPPSSSSSTAPQTYTSSPAQRLGGRTSIKRRGNIYSLRDNQDDNDENNTWNGNSTQQM
uniref:UBX domain-containing protein 4 n=1 Tax=Triatoma dimidiata TaxID=72491 RepID=A0A0V0G337_TRIDM